MLVFKTKIIAALSPMLETFSILLNYFLVSLDPPTFIHMCRYEEKTIHNGKCWEALATTVIAARSVLFAGQPKTIPTQKEINKI